jgi:hypothetical protein
MSLILWCTSCLHLQSGKKGGKQGGNESSEWQLYRMGSLGVSLRDALDELLMVRCNRIFK